ncbi:lipid A export permease/ATP-binding protein MsbA [Curvibacter sp. CHRR-16]|uniref:lipid A export permease/ATP-binding protein MsbA n=1 Tax=Curvibacter sp. CHRR-16 TaxID=2835872 RepID=UPI001BD9268D|nr:lipid A export permease/ATP-binding protein MsbA [Curvibacter sp. CHRR-16]MBT0571783.1 lipid A export permease/ATP-binding protein MsbA [Curvibacter sp. CHRR-16]
MDKANNQTGTQLYLRLLGYLRPHWRVFSLAILGMVGTATTEPVFPAIMKYLLDHGFQAERSEIIWAAPIAIILLFLVRGLLAFTTSYLMSWISTQLVTDLRREMFAKLLLLPTKTFHDQSAGTLATRLLYHADNVNQAATTVLVTAIRESFTAVALLCYLLYLDWKLTCITLTIGPLIAFVVQRFNKRARQASRNSLHAIQQIAHTIEEAINANKVIKIYGGQLRESDRFRADTERFRRAMMKETVPASALTPITHLAAALAVAIITYLALNQGTQNGTHSAGGFASFITALLLLIAPIKQLTTIHPILQRGLAACESVFSLLDTATETDKGVLKLSSNFKKIEFKCVNFRYPSSEKSAITDLSFTLHAGQTIALVGSSGSGKTTIGNLLPRFYEIDSGSIEIDECDIRNFSLLSLRAQIALVSQEIVLFNDSVYANIAMGISTETNREAVIAAAQAANAWDFIQELPQGLDTRIGEDGAKLSGGQRQRLAIARAILKNAPILILDEATSALDTESERVVQAALAQLMKNRTTLVIAHRLSTIEKADQILVLHQGAIVEQGVHTELLQRGGYYANLNRMQL